MTMSRDFVIENKTGINYLLLSLFYNKLLYHCGRLDLYIFYIHSLWGLGIHFLRPIICSLGHLETCWYHLGTLNISYTLWEPLNECLICDLYCNYFPIQNYGNSETCWNCYDSRH